MAVVLYAPTIFEAIASGDSAEMRRVLRLADEHLSEWGDMPAAVTLLQAELAKAERHA